MIATIVLVMIILAAMAVGVTVNDHVRRHHWRAVARERAAR